MKVYLFSPLETTHRKTFYSHIRLQNLKIAGVVSLVVGLASLLIRLGAEFLPQTKELPPQQAHELRIANSLLMATSLAMALIIILIRKKIAITQQNQYHFLALLYAFIVLGGFMSL